MLLSRAVLLKALLSRAVLLKVLLSRAVLRKVLLSRAVRMLLLKFRQSSRQLHSRLPRRLLQTAHLPTQSRRLLLRLLHQQQSRWVQALPLQVRLQVRLPA